jgi:hypothetical protein
MPWSKAIGSKFAVLAASPSTAVLHASGATHALAKAFKSPKKGYPTSNPAKHCANRLTQALHQRNKQNQPDWLSAH